MKKLSKGAFAMVIAGAVTFSVTNALLFQESSKPVVKEKNVALSEAPKKSDGINQEEKTTKDQTAMPSLDNDALQAPDNNRNMNETTIAANDHNAEKVTKVATTNSTYTNVDSTIPPSGTSSKGATSTTPSTPTGNNTPGEQAPTPTGTNTPSEQAPTPTGNNTPSEQATTTTPTATETNTPSEQAPGTAVKPAAPGSNPTKAANYGQQVSQAVKEENQANKANNGKNM